MLKIEAPYPLIQWTSILPSPLLGNAQNLTATVQIKRAMSGITYSHVKSSGRRLFTFSFIVTEGKRNEIVELVTAYGSEQWRITDHHNRIIIGYLKTNPLVVTMDRRGKYCTDNDSVNISFEFEGTIQ